LLLPVTFLFTCYLLVDGDFAAARLDSALSV
jgi:hypothetical protein